MGIRSFLIKFNTVEDIKKYFEWRKYLSYLTHKYYDIKWNVEEYNDILAKGLPDEKSLKEYENEDFGDFDIYLVGFKFWAGCVWGLISTQSVGEATFYLIQKILDTYYSRLFVINTRETDYNDVKPVFIEDYYENPNVSKAIDIFAKLEEENRDKFIDYNLVITTNKIKFEDEKFIEFMENDIFELFNINYKK